MPSRYGTNQVAQPFRAEADTGFFEANYAAFQTESSILNGIEMYADSAPEVTEADRIANPDWNVQDHIPEEHKGTEYEMHYDGMGSLGQVEWKRNNVNEEISLRQTAGEGFWKTLPGNVLGGLASVSTPLDLLVVGKVLKAGGSVAKQAIKAGSTSGALVGLDEVILRNNQDLRTPIETAMGIAGGAILPMGLTAALAKTPVVRLTADEQAAKIPDNFVEEGTGDGGAAKVWKDVERSDVDRIRANGEPKWKQDAEIMKLQGMRYEVVAKSAVNVAGGKWLKWLMPDVSMALNNWSTMRRFGGKTARPPLLLKGDQMDLGEVPLVDMASRWDDQISASVNTVFGDAYRIYKSEGGTLPRADVDREIANAISTGGKHADKNIEDAANLFIKESDQLGRDLVSVGILKNSGDGTPVKPLGDEQWFQRTWSTNYALSMRPEEYANKLVELEVAQLRKHADKEKLRNHQDDLRQSEVERVRLEEEAFLKSGDGEQISSLKNSIRDIKKQVAAAKSPDTIKTLNKSLKKFEGQLKRTIDPYHRKKKLRTKEQAGVRKEAEKADKERTQYQDRLKTLDDPVQVKGLYDRYIGMHRQIAGGNGMEIGGNSMELNSDGSISFIDGRTVDIATVDIPKEFLEGDLVMNVTRAMQRLKRQELALNDSRFGDDTFSNWHDELWDEHQVKLEEIKDKKLGDKGELKATEKLSSEYRRNKGYIQKMMQSYYQISQPVQSEILRNVADVAKQWVVLTKLGSVMASTLGETLAGMNTFGVRGYLRHATSWMSDPSAMRAMTIAQRNDYALGLQTGMMSRITETGDYNAGMGGKMRSLHKVTDFAVDKGFGLGVWTRMITAQTGIMAQAKLGRLALKKGISKRDLTDLNRLGIDSAKFQRIQKEVQAHHKKIAGSVDIGISKWADKELADDVVNSIFREVKNTIITPMEGSTPFIGKHPYASVALQFKHFLIASTSKYWLSDVQRVAMGDMRGLERQMAFMGMGAVMWTLKRDYLYGGDKKENKEIDGEFIQAAISAGGGIGFAMEAYNAVDELLLEGSNSRYRGARTVQGTMMGPSAGLSLDMLQAVKGVGAFVKGEDIPNDVARSMERLVPGNNWIPTRLAKKYVIPEITK